ncbi:hypothetical protein CRM22_000769 [Opisthorchis felineus]|uniref:Alpha-1,3/1,6-mannosyltransferase ALG2 n=1 Tax=Opisthorchis felineus TaxID=147828 RepID=A0A4S2MDV8_OPIFE|nr:hypothetical protein CRM22_000769 [Opisthorchis felineus]
MAKRIVFLHPDLGIGGAERLVVDAAVAVLQSGYNVKIITNHHDPMHCFEETLKSELNVIVAGSWFPRSIFGRCIALCAYIRLLLASVYLVFTCNRQNDLVFVDQISAPLPLLWLTGFKTLFYCHFPDQLLTDRKTTLKRWYRFPLDYVEERTTGYANKILVNSHFTGHLFLHWDELVDPDKSGRAKPSDVHLVLAGGYDTRVAENVEYHKELTALADELKIGDHVTFVRSCPSEVKTLLISSSDAVLYTPDKEHFGIVPVEAMFLFRPVIALDSGGPRETVLDGSTGFLCRAEPEARLPGCFAVHLARFLNDPSLVPRMGKMAHLRVVEHFSCNAFRKQLCDIISQLSTPNFQ